MRLRSFQWQSTRNFRALGQLASLFQNYFHQECTGGECRRRMRPRRKVDNIAAGAVKRRASKEKNALLFDYKRTS